MYKLILLDITKSYSRLYMESHSLIITLLARNTVIKRLSNLLIKKKKKIKPCFVLSAKPEGCSLLAVLRLVSSLICHGTSFIKNAKPAVWHCLTDICTTGISQASALVTPQQQLPWLQYGLGLEHGDRNRQKQPLAHWHCKKVKDTTSGCGLPAQVQNCPRIAVIQPAPKDHWESECCAIAAHSHGAVSYLSLSGYSCCRSD